MAVRAASASPASHRAESLTPPVQPFEGTRTETLDSRTHGTVEMTAGATVAVPVDTR